MYIIENGKKIPIKKNAVIESFSVDWKDSKTWFILTGIILAVIFVVLLIIFLAQCGKSQPDSFYTFGSPSMSSGATSGAGSMSSSRGSGPAAVGSIGGSRSRRSAPSSGF